MWLLLLLIFASETQAHPTYVRLGYTSCTGCHVNTQGGGLLTPYGQGIAMTQALIDSEPEDEEERRYLLAFQGRVMRYETKDETRTFPMQMDLLGAVKVSEKFSLEGTLAIAPKPKDEPPEEDRPAYRRIYGRRLGASYTFEQEGFAETKFYVGLSPLPMGIGLVDHTAYVRNENRRYVTDIPITAQFYFAREKFYGHTFIYRPNPQEEEENKEAGYGAQWFYRPHQNVAIGVQGLSGESETILRREAGLLLKAGMGRFAYMAELDRTWRELKDDNSEFRQWAWYQQLSFYAWEWLHLYGSLQGLERDREFENRERREAVGVEWRLWSHLILSFESRTRITDLAREHSQLAQIYINGW